MKKKLLFENDTIQSQQNSCGKSVKGLIILNSKIFVIGVVSTAHAFQFIIIIMINI